MTEKPTFTKDPRGSNNTVEEEITRNEAFAEMMFRQLEMGLANLGKELTRDSKILEIGTGKAILLAYLHKKGFNAVGVDSRPRGNSEESVVAARVEQLPFPDETFDVLISTGLFDSTLYENQNQEMMVEEISRVLKQKGLYVNMLDNIESIGTLTKTLKPLTGPGYKSCHIYQKE